MSEHPTEVLATPLFYNEAGECTQNNVVSHYAILQGRISFDQDGIRDGRRLFIYQMRYISGNSDM